MPPTTGDLQRAAATGSFWTSIHATVGLPLSVVVNIVVARTLGPREFGYVATLTAAYALVTTIANAGISEATVQWGARAYAQGRRDDLRALVRRCAGFHLFVETPLVAAITVVLLHGATWNVRLVTAAAAATTMAIGTATVAQMLLSRTALLARVTMATNVAVQAAVAAAALTSGSGYTTWAMRTIVSAAIPVLLWLRLPHDIRSAVVRPLAPVGWPAGLVRYSLQAAVGGLVATLVFSRTEIFVLQARHLAVDAGLFGLAYGISVQLTAPLDAVVGPLIPAAASLAAVAPERMAGAIRRGLHFTALAAGLIMAIVVPPMTVLVAPLYGSQFAAVSRLLLPLAVVSCVQSLAHPITAFLYALRRAGAMLVMNTVAFALDIGIAVAFIPVLHAWGAAIANAAAQASGLVFAALMVRRAVGIDLRDLTAASRALGIGILAGGAGWAVANLVPFPSPALGAAAGLVTGTVLFLAMQLPGPPLLARPELELLLDTLPRSGRRPTADLLTWLRIADRNPPL